MAKVGVFYDKAHRQMSLMTPTISYPIREGL